MHAILRESLPRKSYLLRFSSVVSRVVELLGIVKLVLLVTPDLGGDKRRLTHSRSVDFENTVITIVNDYNLINGN